MTLLISKHHSSYSAVVNGVYIETNKLDNILTKANNYIKIIIQ